MRPGASLLPLLLLAAGCHGSGDTRIDFDARATADLSAITRGDCAAVAGHFDHRVAVLTAPELCAGFVTYTRQFGELRSEDRAGSVKRGALAVVRIPLHLARSAGEFRETFHADGSVAGIFFLRPGVALP
ncbi:MAG: hypothetical protein JWO22_337 [Frankiales bacterium]|nr:hypothetical protein [Frankiales bacterium]